MERYLILFTKRTIILYNTARKKARDIDMKYNLQGTFLFRYNTWVTNKKQEKVLLWYNLIGQTTIERRTNSCARIIPQKLTIVNVCLSME